MNLTVKEGVMLHGLDARIWTAAWVVCQAFGGVARITSGREGKHHTASWHYKGRALDFSWPNKIVTFEERQKVVGEIAGIVGSRFEFKIHITHLHMELERG
jgi:hypothetical protein